MKCTNKVVIDGVEYHINPQEKMRAGEYISVDSILKDDKRNYAAILAILCRKDGEVYDAHFENEVLQSRIELFENQSIMDVMPLIFFFYQLMDGIRVSYPIVFDGQGRNKPHSQAYREFKEKWGIVDTLYQIAEEKIEKIGEVYQLYVNDFLQFLSYQVEKQVVDDEEDKYQDTIRKAKRGK